MSKMRIASLVSLVAVFGVAGAGCFDSVSDNCSLNGTCNADGTPIGTGGTSGGNSGSGSGGTSGGASGTPNGGAGGDSNGGSSGDGGSGGTGGGAGGTSGGVGGTSGGTGGIGPTCDPKKTPDDGGCLDGVIYASPVASEAGDGSKAKPFKALSDAITAAAAVKSKTVVACADETTPFTAAATLTVSADDVRVYGGFDCATWEHSTSKSKLLSTASLALQVKAVKFTLVDFAVQAANGSAPGESSVALWAAGSPKLTLTRVELVAGKGQAGAAGALTSIDFSTLTVTAAESGKLNGGGAGCLLNCPGTSVQTTGGRGASPSKSDATSGDPFVSANANSCVPDVTKGASGAPGTPGNGAPSYGQLTPTGWQPAAGTNGGVGGPGQGGGGGASTTSGGGGGGGCGGCGGAGATGATGGGGSIALLSDNSTVALTTVKLITSDAGNGGDSPTAQSGMTMEAAYDLGPRGNGYGLACIGGNGGAGGTGGRGGGGAGGVSVGILYKGAAPTLGATVTFQLGKAGTAGAGGGTPAVAGTAQDTLSAD